MKRDVSSSQGQLRLAHGHVCFWIRVPSVLGCCKKNVSMSTKLRHYYDDGDICIVCFHLLVTIRNA